ncbi:G-type lectin S-receptor-like serine/threonine-protein kinase At2g19130 isoform X2 [Rhododendron vialii]|uniref:G-type lectin S-receptor-like serine/threonine-protein kinase At2g19130 isoform X2 n=1 Tax=Rhododendron vialii TaxID=182163 RepID=UPI00265FC574|nr:G-type lectin S-receptor-like serine/threonine-protein kinase At2g19130 isoform X2 [Rhododendron vialii]
MGVRTNSSFLFLLLFLLFTFNLPIISHGSDTISTNQSLSGDQSLVSANGNFKLGFYDQPGNSSNYYICIVYNKVSLRTIAWMANRDKPISDKYSSVLKIIDGNLVLLNESQIPIWSTNQNSSTASSSVVAVLGDDGNLVVKDGFNSTQPLWQSFDFPTDTWLPGGKIAYNKRTKTHQNLTSWKNSEDPSRGLFSLSLKEDTKENVISWNGSKQYWTSGSWNGQIFSLIPESRLNHNYNFSYIDNENESYFTYSVSNPAIISRFVMDVSGQITQRIWLETSGQWNFYWSQPREQCQVSALCGAFGACNGTKPFCNCLKGFSPKSVGDWNLSDYSGGCARTTKLQCGNTSVANQESTDKFYEYRNVGWLQSDYIGPDYSLSSSAAGCASSCLNNCSCTAYSHDKNWCSIWIGELVNLKQLSPSDGSGITLYLRLAASEFSKGKENKGIIIGAVAGSVAVVLLLGLMFILIWKRQRRFVGKTKVEGSSVAFGYRDLQISTKNFSQKMFTHEELRVATRDFEERLGGGGFGSVFKGVLPDGTEIAVKRLYKVGRAVREFLAEVETIGSIHHFNLVRLVGFSAEKSCLLVYEYMSNGSLDKWIFHRDQKPCLDWETRKKIIHQIAKGLAYLHEECRQRIIHLDIKPPNILLDANFNAKISDFGLSKLVDRDDSQVLITLRGTPGYIAPECGHSKITIKVDIYSFGIVLLEIVTGRRNLDGTRSESSKHLLSLMQKKAREFQLLDIVENLNEEMPENREEMLRMIRIAAWCLQNDPTKRPLMSTVVKVLEGVMEVDPSISYNFTHAMGSAASVANGHVSATLQASVLSNPR